MKKPQRRPWLLCLIAPISSVANWVDGIWQDFVWLPEIGLAVRAYAPVADSASSDLDVTWAAALFGIAVSEMGLKPRRSAEGTVAGKIRNRRQVSALHVCILWNPTGGVGNVGIPKGFPKSVGRVGSRLHGFPCFPYSVISMACFARRPDKSATPPRPIHRTRHDHLS
jgi:hypothetical protein